MEPKFNIRFHQVWTKNNEHLLLLMALQAATSPVLAIIIFRFSLALRSEIKRKVLRVPSTSLSLPKKHRVT